MAYRWLTVGEGFVLFLWVVAIGAQIWQGKDSAEIEYYRNLFVCGRHLSGPQSIKY